MQFPMTTVGIQSYFSKRILYLGKIRIESQSANNQLEHDQWRREYGSEKPQLVTATSPRARSAWDCIYIDKALSLLYLTWTPVSILLFTQELRTAKGSLFSIIQIPVTAAQSHTPQKPTNINQEVVKILSEFLIIHPVESRR